MTDKKIVLSATGSREDALGIARSLVEQKLAACVNVLGPVQSVYRWQGAVEEAEEHLLLIKTTAGAVGRVQEALSRMHSYEVPECVQLGIEAGSQAYLQWLGENVN